MSVICVLPMRNNTLLLHCVLANPSVCLPLDNCQFHLPPEPPYCRHLSSPPSPNPPSLSPTFCAFLSNVFRTRMKLDDKASHNCMSLAHICPQHCSLAPSPGALNAIPHHVQCPTVSTAQSPISMTSTRPPSFLGDLHSYQDDGR